MLKHLFSFDDSRGEFKKLYSSSVDCFEVRQVSWVKNSSKGTVRGFHAQENPMITAPKRLIVLSGKIIDVLINVRRFRLGDPSWWFSVELTPSSVALDIPVGWLHGYQTLDPDTKVIEVKNGPFVSVEHDKVKHLWK